jgi:hypothetical protein
MIIDSATMGGYPFTASGEFWLSQYWDQNSSAMVFFAPGRYSLLVGDIWGSYAILYFDLI